MPTDNVGAAGSIETLLAGYTEGGTAPTDGVLEDALKLASADGELQQAETDVIQSVAMSGRQAAAMKKAIGAGAKNAVKTFHDALAPKPKPALKADPRKDAEPAAKPPRPRIVLGAGLLGGCAMRMPWEQPPQPTPPAVTIVVPPGTLPPNAGGTGNVPSTDGASGTSSVALPVADFAKLNGDILLRNPSVLPVIKPLIDALTAVEKGDGDVVETDNEATNERVIVLRGLRTSFAQASAGWASIITDYDTDPNSLRPIEPASADTTISGIGARLAKMVSALASQADNDPTACAKALVVATALKEVAERDTWAQGAAFNAGLKEIADTTIQTCANKLIELALKRTTGLSDDLALVALNDFLSPLPFYTWTNGEGMRGSIEAAVWQYRQAGL